MKLQELLEEPENKGYSKDTEIKNITESLSEVVDGSLFVAVKGQNFDGNDFIGKAVERGAVAIITESKNAFAENCNVNVVTVKNARRALAYASNVFYGKPAEKLCMIGITGTNGKTTTAHMIFHILVGNGIKCGLIGTGNIKTDRSSIPNSCTTPDSVKLFSVLSDMVSNGITHVVMEVSSHALEQERVFGIKFKIGIFTNLSVDHLDYHKNMKNYQAAKLKLFGMSENCIVNKDSDFSEPFVDFKKNGTDVYTFSTCSDADFKAENIRIFSEGNKYDIVKRNSFTVVNVAQHISGLFNVYNSVAAYIACTLLGLSDDKILLRISDFSSVKGRMERIKTPKGFTVIIDYAHTPDGLMNILNSIRLICKGEILTVFGCGGDRDKTKRPLMGRIAQELSDKIIVTSDNPRSEDPNGIIGDILSGITEDSSVSVIPDRGSAVRYALSVAGEDDVVLLAGKGHEVYQTVKGVDYHFDEREIIENYFRRE